MRYVTSLLVVAPALLLVETAKLHSPIDLSHYYDANTVTWPNFTRFHFINTVAGTKNGFWFAANEFETAEHGGTHMDAPYHFNKQGWKIGDIPMKRFFGQGEKM